MAGELSFLITLEVGVVVVVEEVVVDLVVLIWNATSVVNLVILPVNAVCVVVLEDVAVAALGTAGAQVMVVGEMVWGTCSIFISSIIVVYWTGCQPFFPTPHFHLVGRWKGDYFCG